VPSSEPSSDRPAASLREAQGRLFWAWLFTLPILLILGASRVFGAPWPDELLQDLAMLALAFPVLFVVGLPLFHLERTGSTGPDRERARWTALDRLVATLRRAGCPARSDVPDGKTSVGSSPLLSPDPASTAARVLVQKRTTTPLGLIREPAHP